MAKVVSESGAGIVLMHMRGTPATMQMDPHYQDAAGEIASHLKASMARARAAGIAEECVALDPGIGFGKTARHSFELLARLGEITALGRPVLVGVSRKSFLAEPEPLPVDERLEAGLAATAVAVFQGARLVRTHDVAATLRAVRIADALRAARRDAPAD
jgi:dihydropteroate synthase